MKKQDVFPNATNLKTIMCGNDNKTRIQNLVRSEFMNAAIDKTLIWSIDPNCEDLKNGSEITEFECYQAEADTILVSIYYAIREMGENCTVVIDSEDTDVYVQAAYASLMGICAYGESHHT